MLGDWVFVFSSKLCPLSWMRHFYRNRCSLNTSYFDIDASRMATITNQKQGTHNLPERERIVVGGLVKEVDEAVVRL